MLKEENKRMKVKVIERFFINTSGGCLYKKRIFYHVRSVSVVFRISARRGRNGLGCLSEFHLHNYNIADLLPTSSASPFLVWSAFNFPLQ